MLIDDKSTSEKILLTGMTKEAHDNNLLVYPYTIHADVLPKYITDVDKLYEIIYDKVNADAAFTHFPDKGVHFLQKQRQRN